MKEYLKPLTLRLFIPSIIVFTPLFVFTPQIKDQIPELIERVPLIEVGEDSGTPWMQPVTVQEVVSDTSFILTTIDGEELNISLTGVIGSEQEENVERIKELIPEGVELYIEREQNDEGSYLWITDKIEEDEEFVKGYMLNAILLDEGIVQLDSGNERGKYHELFKQIVEEQSN